MLYWFDVAAPIEPYQAPAFPVFIWELQERRNVIYGFNDGLTANFGLVAGMIGATVAEQPPLRRSTPTGLPRSYRTAIHLVTRRTLIMNSPTNHADQTTRTTTDTTTAPGIGEVWTIERIRSLGVTPALARSKASSAAGVIIPSE